MHAKLLVLGRTENFSEDNKRKTLYQTQRFRQHRPVLCRSPLLHSLRQHRTTRRRTLECHQGGDVVVGVLLCGEHKGETVRISLPSSRARRKDEIRNVREHGLNRALRVVEGRQLGADKRFWGGTARLARCAATAAMGGATSVHRGYDEQIIEGALGSDG